MNKKFIQIALTSVIAASTFGAVALSSMQDSKVLYADDPKTQAQYTINGWDLVGQSPNFYDSVSNDDSAGFFFSPKTGRKDIVLGIIIQNQSQGTREEEELDFEEKGTCLAYRSHRKWHEADSEYYYETEVDGVRCFEGARMTYMIGKAKENSYIYDLAELENFSLVNVFVNSWFAYAYISNSGGTTADYYDYYEYDDEMPRIFTPSNPTSTPDLTGHGSAFGLCKCTGFKIDVATLTLTYSCSY